MTNHTISARFEAKAGAGLGKTRPKPGGIVRALDDIMCLVPQVAAVIRDLRQVQYATAEERRAIEILSALQVVRNYDAQHFAEVPRPSTDTTLINEKDLPPQSEETDAKPKEEVEKKAETDAKAKEKAETKSNSKK